MASKPMKKIKPLTKEPTLSSPSSPRTQAPVPPPPPVTVISIPSEEGGPPLNAINIVPDGDVVLDVTFDLSKETLRAARKAANTARPRPRPSSGTGISGSRQQTAPTASPQSAALKSNTRLLYRTHLSILKQHSKYFTSLLGDPRFTEAKSITATFEKLSLEKIKPSQAEIKDLPRVKIGIDDEETQLAEQEAVFGDLLRMLHGQVIVTDPLSMAYLSTLAVLADRFGCSEPVGKSLHGQLRFKAFKWPATQVRMSREEDGVALTRAAEDLLRQKIYVSWLLDLPLRFQKATGELIMYGSRQWREFEDEDGTENNTAAWWYLPDELEDELNHRRTSILTTVASVPAHFIGLYSGTSPHLTSPTPRQCKLGYDSSAPCDSYQLGETLKFLLKRNLIALSYLSSPQELPADWSTTEITHILSVLKQFPSYQIDKNHTNCGPRTRLKPILDFLTVMVAHKSVAISRLDWVRRRHEVSWLSDGSSHSHSGQGPAEDDNYEMREGDRDPWTPKINSSTFVNGKFQPIPSPLSFSNSNGRDVGQEEKKKKFSFTRSVASDQRLRFEGSMGADRLVRGLFTADEWDWTPEDA
ncbi:hypothetical protein V8F20_012129 [Naviculisporaceae sp. PSN 640]